MEKRHKMKSTQISYSSWVPNSRLVLRKASTIRWFPSSSMMRTCKHTACKKTSNIGMFKTCTTHGRCTAMASLQKYLSSVNEGCVLDKMCCPKLLHKKMETERYDGNRVLSDVQHVVLGKSPSNMKWCICLEGCLFRVNWLARQEGRNANVKTDGGLQYRPPQYWGTGTRIWHLVPLESLYFVLCYCCH